MNPVEEFRSNKRYKILWQSAVNGPYSRNNGKLSVRKVYHEYENEADVIGSNIKRKDESELYSASQSKKTSEYNGNYAIKGFSIAWTSGKAVYIKSITLDEKVASTKSSIMELLFPRAVTSICFNSEGRDKSLLAVGTAGGEVHIIDCLVSKSRIIWKNSAADAVTSILWLRSELNNLFCCHESGMIRILNSEEEEREARIAIVENPIKSISAFGGANVQILRLSESRYQLQARISCASSSEANGSVTLGCKEGVLCLLKQHGSVSLDRIYNSYYGSIICNHISKDGRFLFFGGEDDIISLFDLVGHRRIRCEGHSSWISGISEFSLASKKKTNEADKNAERVSFVSVAWDGCIAFWEYQEQLLHRPRRNSSHSIRKNQEKDAVDSNIAMGASKELRSKMDQTLTGYAQHEINRNAGFLLEPVHLLPISKEPLSGVHAIGDAFLIIASKSGNVVVYSSMDE